MDQNQPEPSFEESIKQVMQTLPPVIRTYLSEGRYTPVAKSLMMKYNLRIDQGGVLEREIMLLLMGVEDPTEFTQALVEEAQLDKVTINSIVKDVNDLIFVPLRQEEESGAVAKPTVPTTRPQQPLAPHIASLPPKMTMPTRSTGSLGDIVRSVTAPKMLEDHEEPHIDFSQVPTPPAARIISPISVNLPGTMPAPAAPVAFIQSKPAAPAPADPYREPIDEPLNEM